MKQNQISCVFSLLLIETVQRQM